MFVLILTSTQRNSFGIVLFFDRHQDWSGSKLTDKFGVTIKIELMENPLNMAFGGGGERGLNALSGSCNSFTIEQIMYRLYIICSLEL